MNELLTVGSSPSALVIAIVVLGLLSIVLMVVAPALSERLLRYRAGTLPSAISKRLLEEWIAEAQAIDSRFLKLAFALDLVLTRASAFTEAESIASPIPSHTISVADVTVPSGFSVRVVTLLLDSLFGMGVSFAIALLSGFRAPSLPFVGLMPSIAWFLLMDVYFVQRFGGSPGKLLAKLRIVTLDGHPIKYHHALVRALPFPLLRLVSNLIATGLVLNGTSWAEFSGMGMADQARVLRALDGHGLLIACSIVSSSWLILDIMAFFASYEYRALHDRVAGTIVIHKIPVITASAAHSSRMTSATR